MKIGDELAHQALAYVAAVRRRFLRGQVRREIPAAVPPDERALSTSPEAAIPDP